MNKLLLAGLMVFSVNSVFAMGTQEREMLYTLNTLEQDFAQVSMITQNIDMFMSVLEMNINLNEARLINENLNLATIFQQSVVLFIGGLVGKVAFTGLVDKCVKPTENLFSLRNILIQGSYALGGAIGITWPTLSIHDAWKTRSALIEALARDKEILAKLQAIQAGMAKNIELGAQHAESTENFLLESAE